MYHSPWEDEVGYARVRRAGPFAFVSGTTAVTGDGAVVGGNDAYEQARTAIANIATALSAEGLGLEHVVRTRLFVADITRWEEIGRAHAEAFGAVRPAASMVEVARFIDPRLLVEIEATAYDAAASDG